MSKPVVIQVFEHDTIYVNRKYGEVVFEPKHFDALARYNDAHDRRFFQLGNKNIKFRHYVGVLQVGQLTIEILPKADRNPQADKQKWQGILIEMLRTSKYLRLESSGYANQQLRQQNLIDIFVARFLTEVERLMHQGLVRQYRITEGNRKSLSGRLQFAQHLQHNLIHKERFFVRHQVYDHQHLLHQIIHEALLCLQQAYPSVVFRSRIARLLLDFPVQSRLKITASNFQYITYNRKTNTYQEAIGIAKLILLHFAPDLRSGQQHVLAILFDMNQLFEDYVFQLLKRTSGIRVFRQKSKRFWEKKLIRPDILLELPSPDGKEQLVILDTKWKVLSRAIPSIEDLKQMYVYQHYWKTQTSFLIYPAVQGLEDRTGSFHLPKESNLLGGLLFLDIENQRPEELAQNLLDRCKKQLLLQ